MKEFLEKLIILLGLGDDPEAEEEYLEEDLEEDFDIF